MDYRGGWMAATKCWTSERRSASQLLGPAFRRSVAQSADQLVASWRTPRSAVGKGLSAFSYVVWTQYADDSARVSPLIGVSKNSAPQQFTAKGLKSKVLQSYKLPQ